MMLKPLLLAGGLLLSGCDRVYARQKPEGQLVPHELLRASAKESASELRSGPARVVGFPLPSRPGSLGGLPDDRDPMPERRAARDDAPRAAAVVQSYAALIEAHQYGRAERLWVGSGALDGRTLANRTMRYAEWHALVGHLGGSKALPVRLTSR